MGHNFMDFLLTNRVKNFRNVNNSIIEIISPPHLITFHRQYILTLWLLAFFKGLIFTRISDSDLSEPEEGEIEDSLDYCSSIADKSEKQGPTINSKLADGVTEILKSGLNATAKEDFKDMYICQENCKRMEVVTVNLEILNTASGHTKKQDHTSRLLQAELMKGLMASCAAYNQLYDLTLQESFSKKDLRRTLRPLSDSISLQANASHTIDIERRLNFKKDIKEEFASLCTGSYPVESQLFGSELQDKIKTADETAKLKQKVSITKRTAYTSRKPYQGKAYNKSSSSFFAQKKGGGATTITQHRKETRATESLLQKEQSCSKQQHKGKSNNSNNKFTRKYT